VSRKDERIKELETEVFKLRRQVENAPHEEVRRLQRKIDSMLAEQERKRTVDMETTEGQIRNAFRNHDKIQFNIEGMGKTQLESRQNAFDLIEQNVPSGFRVSDIWDSQPVEPIYNHAFDPNTGESVESVRGWRTPLSVTVERYEDVPV
jgi:hypothetical protein